MSPGHVTGLHGSPSHNRPRSLGGKKWLCGPGPQFPHCVQHRDLVPCISATPAIAKRDQGKTRPVVSEGASPKPWQFPHGVEPEGAQKSRTKVWNLCLDFRRCMETPGCPGRSLLQGWGPHGELLLGQHRREMWGWSTHTKSLLGHCLVEL